MQMLAGSVLVTVVFGICTGGGNNDESAAFSRAMRAVGCGVLVSRFDGCSPNERGDNGAFAELGG